MLGKVAIPKRLQSLPELSVLQKCELDGRGNLGTRRGNNRASVCTCGRDGATTRRVYKISGFFQEKSGKTDSGDGVSVSEVFAVISVIRMWMKPGGEFEKFALLESDSEGMRAFGWQVVT